MMEQVEQMAQSKKKKRRIPKWRNWPPRQIIYFAIWLAIISVAHGWLFRRLPFLPDISLTAHALILMSATITLGSFIFWSIFIDGETMFNRLFGFVLFPLKLLFFPVSFTREFRKIWKAHKNHFPIKSIYFFLLIVGLSTALLDTSHGRLGVSEYLLWFCLISTLITCFSTVHIFSIKW